MDDPAGSRKVLLLVEDETLGEVLEETLRQAGHQALRLPDGADLEAALDAQRFDTVIVDLDTRAHNGGELIARLRHSSPETTIVALLPCGGLPVGAAVPLGYHAAIEKPARLAAVLSAVQRRKRP